jgi:hypothetical protein
MESLFGQTWNIKEVKSRVLNFLSILFVAVGIRPFVKRGNRTEIKKYYCKIANNLQEALQTV